LPVLCVPNLAISEQEVVSFGFRDLRIGAEAILFEYNCDRGPLYRMYTCYKIDDLVFHWNGEPGQMVPRMGDIIRDFTITFENPKLLSLKGEARSAYLESDEYESWPKEKQNSLFIALSKKYKLNWHWDDPEFPERRERQLERFSNQHRYSLDSVFEDGQIILRLFNNNISPPSVSIQYLDKEKAAKTLEEMGRGLSANELKTIKETDEGEF